MKCYTLQRSKAKNDFEKDFYKLMNNSVFGKTMENVRTHIEAKLCTNDRQKNLRIRNPRCTTWKIFNKDLTIVKLNKKKVILNKPIYAGFSILELSKVHMMNFHYDYIYNKYGQKAQLLFTDTDSLTYHIETEDLYQDMYENRELFDFSDYNINSPFYDSTNKKVIGKFKDESLGKVITEFIGLRAKCYSVFHGDEINKKDQQKNTAKGVTRCVKEKYLTHDQYYNVLFNQEVLPTKQRGFRTEKHEVYSVETKKISLSPYDNKRFILDGVTTRAYGHYSNNEPKLVLI